MAVEDLMEALQLAPENRELRRLLVRVKEECREQARLDSSHTIIVPTALSSSPSGKFEHRPPVPDIVPSMNDKPPLQERRREETAL